MTQKITTIVVDICIGINEQGRGSHSRSEHGGSVERAGFFLLLLLIFLLLLQSRAVCAAAAESGNVARSPPELYASLNTTDLFLVANYFCALRTSAKVQ